MAKSFSLSTVLKIVMLALLGGAAWSYTLPLLEVKVPPVGAKTISAWELTEPALKSMTKKKSKAPKLKLDKDFYEILEKILPKNKKTGKANKFSLTFVMGILVPFAILLTYLLILLSGAIFFFAPSGLLKKISAVAVVTSSYGLAGTYYLGQAAQNSFQKAVGAKSEGLLGAVTKHLVSEITIKPDLALYVLFGLALGAWLIHFMAVAGKK